MCRTSTEAYNNILSKYVGENRNLSSIYSVSASSRLTFSQMLFYADYEDNLVCKLYLLHQTLIDLYVCNNSINFFLLSRRQFYS